MPATGNRHAREAVALPGRGAVLPRSRPVFAAAVGSRRQSFLLQLAVVLVAALAVHAAAIGHGWVWDDFVFIVDNLAVHDIGNARHFFTNADSFGTGVANPYYRPITTLSFALSWLLSGENPAGHHAMNIFLHLVVGALLLIVLRGMFTEMAALGGALLFVVHPATVEPVSYVSARADLLCAAFILGSFLAYRRHLEGGTRRSLALSVLLAVAALLSKIIAVIIPVLLALHLLIVARKKERWPILVPHAVVVLLFAVMRMLVVGDWPAAVPLASRIATAPEIVMTYVRNALVPVGLKVYHIVPIRTTLLNPAAAWSLLSLACIVGALAAVRRRPLIAFGGAWFFLALLPVSGLVMILEPTPVAARYLYIPLAGYAIIAGNLVQYVERSAPTRVLRGGALAVLTVFIVLYAVQAVGLVPVWKEAVTLWSHAALDAPGNRAVMVSMSNSYLRAGKVEEAMRVLELRQAKGEKGYEFFNCMALAAVGQGDLEAAELYIREALRLNPNSSAVYGNFGWIRACRGDQDTAVAALRHALVLNPYNRQARDLLGKILGGDVVMTPESDA